MVVGMRWWMGICTRRLYEMVELGLYVKCVAIADRESPIAAEKPKV